MYFLRIEVSNTSFEHKNNMANVLICLVVCVLSCFNVFFIFVLCQCLWILRSWLSLRFSLMFIQEKYGDTKCLFRSCKSMKANQHNTQNKDKRTNNDLHWQWFVGYIFYWYLQFLNHVTIIKTKVLPLQPWWSWSILVIW